MRILLTGAFGNIGSSILQELLRQGHIVCCFDIKTSKTQKAAQRFQPIQGVEIVWGDLRQAEQVNAVVANKDSILHFAAVIPPQTDKDPHSEDVNIGGTRHLIAAATQQEQPPKFLLASSLDVFGYTQDKEPPRKVTDPVTATDTYTKHKLECEALLQASSLEWAIFRFADVPPLEARSPDPIMFTIPLDTRFEMLHTHDAGLAVANGIRSDIWGQIWLIGGGPSCQVYYRDYLQASLERSGVGMLPAKAFGQNPYCTDWLDTSASQALLQYQRHSFDEIINDISFPSGAAKLLLIFLSPLARHSLLKMSPYWRVATQ